MLHFQKLSSLPLTSSAYSSRKTSGMVNITSYCVGISRKDFKCRDGKYSRTSVFIWRNGAKSQADIASFVLGLTTKTDKNWTMIKLLFICFDRWIINKARKYSKLLRGYWDWTFSVNLGTESLHPFQSRDNSSCCRKKSFLEPKLNLQNI